MAKNLGYFLVLVGASAVIAASQDVLPQAQGTQSAVPREPGLYYESGGELKPVSDKNNKEDLVLSSTLPPLVIVYPQDHVNIKGFYLGPASGLTSSIGIGGIGIGGGLVFSRVISPKKIEPIPGRPDAFRVTFGSLSAEEYLVLSELVDAKDGKKKVMIHGSFVVKRKR